MCFLVLLLLLGFFVLLFKDTLFVFFYAPVVGVFFRKRKKMLSSATLATKTVSYEVLQKHHVNFVGKIKKLLADFSSYYLYKLSLIPSHHIRNFIYRTVCRMSLGKDAVIYYGTEIREPGNIVIGNGSIIGDNSILDGRNGIIIGENVVFASNVKIWTEQHDHRDPWFRCETQEHRPVIIDERAWIGSHTIILHSVHVGTGAVVAAGAVVTHDVEPFSIVAGIPAKKIGERNKDLRYTFSGEHRHFL